MILAVIESTEELNSIIVYLFIYRIGSLSSSGIDYDHLDHIQIFLCVKMKPSYRRNNQGLKGVYHEIVYDGELV